MHEGIRTERLTWETEGRDGIARAASLIQRGGLVAFPTETVYGLGANALDEDAIARIFRAKERPSWDPLIIHVCDRDMLERVVAIPAEIESCVERLMSVFWPGPLTLLLPRSAAVPDLVTSRRPLAGVRMPAHPVALELIRLSGVPIAAPSANRFGHTSPTTAGHVLEDLDGRIDAVLDGGPTNVGLESTVLDPLQTPMVIYRPGAITKQMIATKTGYEAAMFATSSTDLEEQEHLPSPGTALRHYAPKARLELVSMIQAQPKSNSLEAVVEQLKANGESVGVMLPQGWRASRADVSFSWGDWNDLNLLAQRLFAGLRALDAGGMSAIVCPVPEGGGIGVALRDRLERAARRH